MAMANDIGAFFNADPDKAEAASNVASHLKRFWDPRMRREIVAHYREGGAGLDDVARSAIGLLADEGMIARHGSAPGIDCVSRASRITRVKRRRADLELDRAATEEPLEIRLQGRPFAVVMRTPGADRELAAGFLPVRARVASAATSARSRGAPIAAPASREHRRRHADGRRGVRARRVFAARGTS